MNECKIQLNDWYFILIRKDIVELHLLLAEEEYIIDQPNTVKYFIRKYWKPDEEVFKMLSSKKRAGYFNEEE